MSCHKEVKDFFERRNENLLINKSFCHEPIRVLRLEII